MVQVIKGNMSRLHFRVCIKDGGGTVQELQGWIDCRDSCSQEFPVHEVRSLDEDHDSSMDNESSVVIRGNENVSVGP